VALQQLTRQLWPAQGPFELYVITGIPQCNIPAGFIKGATWQNINRVKHYNTQSSVPEESGIPVWYPVEFNSEHICWVEVHWVEQVKGKGYWQAFFIAGEDLGLDITQANVAEQDCQETKLTASRESVTNTPTSRLSTPSQASIIRPQPSPYQPGSHNQEITAQLAELLQLNTPMSNMLTMEAPSGTIDPVTGHVNEDSMALY
jgi:hypothetical protein